VQGVSGVVLFRLGSIVIKAALAVGSSGRRAVGSMRANRESGIWVAPFAQSRQGASAALAFWPTRLTHRRRSSASRLRSPEIPFLAGEGTGPAVAMSGRRCSFRGSRTSASRPPLPRGDLDSAGPMTARPGVGGDGWLDACPDRGISTSGTPSCSGSSRSSAQLGCQHVSSRGCQQSGCQQSGGQQSGCQQCGQG
jgi:hypothetical protein